MKPGNFVPVLALSLILLLTGGCGGDADSTPPKKTPKSTLTQKVKLDIHIMSQCSWSAKVLSTLLPILEKMDGSVDFSVHYIAREEKGEWKSTHGESEIAGDRIQICVNKHAQTTQWLSFLKCQVKDWRKIPADWEECAIQAKVDPKIIKTCADGEEGKTLLVESFQYSLEKGAKGSPTIILAGEPYTGGRTEASFGRAICEKFSDAKPEYCAKIPEPIKVPVTIVTDKRCEGRSCNPRRFTAFIRNTFDGAEIRTIDYADPEGKIAYEKSGQQWLPVAIFGPSVEKAETGFNRLKRHMVKLEASGEYIYPIGNDGKPPWDPKAEICNDGVDNTGNGMIDCADDSCNGKIICRNEIPGKLDLFVMSHCHFGVRTLNAMAPVLEHFGNDRAQIDFKVQFIGKIVDDKLTALHGQREVDENKRQICAQKYYSKNYRFMEYILCRNEAFQKNNGREDETAWETCANGTISAAILKKCSEGEEGTLLLKESYQLASSLDFSGSPSWLLNNRYDMRARAPRQIRDAYCAQNPKQAGCKTEMIIDEQTNATPAPQGACDGTIPPVKKVPLTAESASANDTGN